MNNWNPQWGCSLCPSNSRPKQSSIPIPAGIIPPKTKCDGLVNVTICVPMSG
jgi:hypothetical protein